MIELLNCLSQRRGEKEKMIIKIGKRKLKELKLRYEEYKDWCRSANIKYVNFKEWLLR